MNWNRVTRSLALLSLMGCVLAGCRKVEGGGDEVAATTSDEPTGAGVAGAVSPKAGEREGGQPSKLSRDEGRRPDGRKAPPVAQVSKYRMSVPVPGKEGYVFNPFNNNPVDVRGIPPGTLVRDPADPDKEHKFRVP